MKYWKHGQKKALAQMAGVSQSYLSDVLNRRKAVSYGRACYLEKQCKVLGMPDLTALVWLENMSTRHPAFKKKGKV
jgi:DNA-binding transcriptional regulator YdaS (Cro superfamily)